MEATATVSAYELERGKPMPSENHSNAQFYLTFAFGRYQEQYTILPEFTLELGDCLLVPDLCVYPKRSLDWTHDHIRGTDPPLMTVEILSPTQSMNELIEKTEVYFEAGVQSCWIVVPIVQSIYVLTPGEKAKVYMEGAIKDPATDITIQIEEIFR